MGDPEARSVVGIAGSLQQDSLNRALLRAAIGLAPSGLDIAEHTLADIPLDNYDVEQEGDPPGVVALKHAVAVADGVLIATPEYQHGVPGCLKNALEWLSRPPGKPVLQGKPVAIMGASPGMTTAGDPDATLPGFLQSTYEAAAAPAHWDRAALEYEPVEGARPA